MWLLVVRSLVTFADSNSGLEVTLLESPGIREDGVGSSQRRKNVDQNDNAGHPAQLT